MYTLEILSDLTGYSKNTLYNLTCEMGIKPYKNRIKGNPSKGVYDDRALESLLLYKKLTQESRMKKKEAMTRVLSAKIL